MNNNDNPDCDLDPLPDVFSDDGNSTGDDVNDSTDDDTDSGSDGEAFAADNNHGNRARFHNPDARDD
ncbi:hypothetical protein BGZ95_006798, partial [Linnemannia exigua]